MIRTALRKVSKSLAKALVVYRKLREIYLEEHPVCEKCGYRRSETIHHKKGRGIYLNSVEYFMATCMECHQWIENNKGESMRLGYIISRLSK